MFIASAKKMRPWECKKKSVGEREDVRKKKVSQAKINEQFLLFLLVLRRSFGCGKKNLCECQQETWKISNIFSHLIALWTCCETYWYLGFVVQFHWASEWVRRKNVTRFQVPMDSQPPTLHSMSCIRWRIFICVENSSSSVFGQAPATI